MFKAVATIKKPIPNVHKKKVQVRTLPHQNWSFVQFPGVSAPLDAMATLQSYLDELPAAAHHLLDAVSPPPMRGRLWLTCLVTIQPKAQEALVTTTSWTSLCAEENNFRTLLAPCLLTAA